MCDLGVRDWRCRVKAKVGMIRKEFSSEATFRRLRGIVQQGLSRAPGARVSSVEERILDRQGFVINVLIRIDVVQKSFDSLFTYHSMNPTSIPIRHFARVVKGTACYLVSCYLRMRKFE